MDRLLFKLNIYIMRFCIDPFCRWLLQATLFVERRACFWPADSTKWCTVVEFNRIIVGKIAFPWGAILMIVPRKSVVHDSPKVKPKSDNVGFSYVLLNSCYKVDPVERTPALQSESSPFVPI